MWAINGLSIVYWVLNSNRLIKSTSFLGEIAAVNLALDYVVRLSNITHTRVLIHSDCQAAIDSIINHSGNNTHLLDEIWRNIITFKNRSIDVQLCWVPGHTGIKANEAADVEAKKAASITKSWSAMDDTSPITVKEVQKETWKVLQKVWQRQWDSQTEGRFAHSLLPNVKLNRHKLDKISGKTLRLADIRLNRIIVGHTLLKAQHLRQSLDSRAGVQVDIQCDCGDGPQDIEHYLLECRQFAGEHTEMTTSIMEAVFKNNECKIKDLSIHLELLIGDVDMVPRDVKMEIRRALLKFLSDTAEDIRMA